MDDFLLGVGCFVGIVIFIFATIAVLIVFLSIMLKFVGWFSGLIGLF